MDLTRRNFLAGSAAFGSLVATSSLPALADDPSLFPKRGRWERLSLGYRHIHVGSEKRFSVLHISDTHLTAAYPHESAWTRNFMKRRAVTFGGRQEEALRDSLSWARQHVDYVIHTGDLIDAQSEANFDLVRKYFGEASGCVTGCIGNHELCREKTADKTPPGPSPRDKVAAAFPFDISLQSTVVNGVNFVTLDNANGPVNAEQAKRFEDEVKKGLPIILCMHCPIMTAHLVRCANRFWKKNDLKGVIDVSGWKERSGSPTAEFVKYLRAQPLLKGILAGHLHFDAQDRFSPTADEYLVGGNFLFHGQEITFS